MNIALIGCHCSGKTAVSRELVELTGWHRVETDRMVEEFLGISIQELVRRFGRDAFRASEEAIVTGQLRRSGIILDTGEGLVTNAPVMERLRRQAFVVFLDCPARVRSSRGSGFGGSSLAAAAAEETCGASSDQRMALYRSYADLTVDATASPAACAAAIVEGVYTEGVWSTGRGAAGRRAS